MIKAPLHNQSTELRYQFGIIVPSTDYDKKISSYEFTNRIKGTKKFLSQLFGGSTSIKEVGSYVSDKGSLIDENGTMVESSMTLEQYKSNIKKVEAYIKKKQKDWKQ
jgi:hypothetical protein